MPSATELTSIYCDLEKYDPSTGEFGGYVSSGRVDVTGQIVDPDWLAKQLPPWITDWANIRGQHNPAWPIGVADEVDLTAKPGPYLRGRVIDEKARRMAENKVFKGLSIGVKNPVVIRDAAAPNGRIVGGTLIEISLVDRPANDDAKLTLYKSVGPNAWRDELTGQTISASPGFDAPIPMPGSPAAQLAEVLAALTKNADATLAPYNLQGQTEKCSLADCACACTPSSADASCTCDCAFCAGARTSERAATPEATKRAVSTKERAADAKDGHAMPGGAYPIDTIADLKNAIQALGRAKDPAATKAHIITRAKALGATALLPADWAGSTKQEEKTAMPGTPDALTPDATLPADATKSAPDFEVVHPTPSTIAPPVTVAQTTTPLAEALLRIEALAGQTDKDQDGDVDFPANDAISEAVRAPDFATVHPAPSTISPAALSLLFAAGTDLHKSVVALILPTLRSALAGDVAALSELFVTKSVAAESLTTAKDVSRLGADLAKGLTALADQAEASAKELMAIKTVVSDTQAELERVKQLAAPIKGVAVAVTKGIGLDPDTYRSASAARDIDGVAGFLEQAYQRPPEERNELARRLLSQEYTRTR